MGNIVYSGQGNSYPNYNVGGGIISNNNIGGWQPGNSNNNIDMPGGNGGGLPPANANENIGIVGGNLPTLSSNNNFGMHGGSGDKLSSDHSNKIPTHEDECDQMSCYTKCRISLQGGGKCTSSECKCYPKYGIKRPEDNTWFELSEQDQKRILDIEDRFEAVPAVMTTNLFDNIASYTIPSTTKMTTSTTTRTSTTQTPTTTLRTTIIETTTEDMSDLIIDQSGEGDNNVFDDSTAWDDGSGAGDDEDSEYEDSDSWW